MRERGVEVGGGVASAQDEDRPRLVFQTRGGPALSSRKKAVPPGPKPANAMAS
jgi:hypothetical protein